MFKKRDIAAYAYLTAIIAFTVTKMFSQTDSEFAPPKEGGGYTDLMLVKNEGAPCYIDPDLACNCEPECHIFDAYFLKPSLDGVKTVKIISEIGLLDKRPYDLLGFSLAKEFAYLKPRSILFTQKSINMLRARILHEEQTEDMDQTVTHRLTNI